MFAVTGAETTVNVIVSAVNARPCGVLSLGVADAWGGAETVDRAEPAGMLSDFAPGRSGQVYGRE